MNSLLPQQYRAAFRREKILRLLFVWMLLCVIVFVAGIVCMTPSYFALVLSRDDVLRRLQVEEEALRRREVASVESTINAINEKLFLFGKNKARRFPFSNLLVGITNQAPAGIKITSIELRRGQNATYVLALQGIASTRENLLTYTDRLRAAEEVASLSAPLSNLLAETNVSFAMEAAIKAGFYRYVGR